MSDLPSSTEGGELKAAYADVLRACDETQAACDAVFERSQMWLWLHPIQTRRMNRRIRETRATMIAARNRYMTLAGRPIPAWPR